MIGQIVAQPIIASVPSPLSPKHLSSIVFLWWSICCQRSVLGWGICDLWIYYFPHTLKKNAMAYKKYRHKLNKISLLLLPKTTRIVRYFEEKSTLLFRGLLEVLETILKSAWQIYYLWNKAEHGLGLLPVIGKNLAFGYKQSILSNNPGNNNVTHFGSCPLVVS